MAAACTTRGCGVYRAVLKATMLSAYLVRVRVRVRVRCTVEAAGSTLVSRKH